MSGRPKNSVAQYPLKKKRRNRLPYLVLLFSAVLLFCGGMLGNWLVGTDWLSNVPYSAHLHSPRDYICFLNVGQADCALLQSQGETALIDSGDLKDNGAALVRKLRRLGVTKIDYLFLTHPHADHIGGAAAVLNAFDVSGVVTAKLETSAQVDGEAVAHMLSAAHSRDLIPFVPQTGDRFEIGNFTLEVLSCDETAQEENDRSMVLLAQNGPRRCLFMADAGEPLEQRLLQEDLLPRVDFLKVGHHGSATATSAAFLARTQPEIAVISVGYNTYGHPAEEICQRLASCCRQVFRTDLHGDLTLYLANGGYQVEVTNEETGNR